MSDFIYINPVAPAAYVTNLVPGTSGIDLSTVSAASLTVSKPDESEVTWTAAMTNQSTATLTLTHVFLLGDVDLKGTYRLFASLTIPSGTVRIATLSFVGKGKYELP